MEDDSQDGADHVDAHRIPALVISPYTQRGAVVHDRYDQLSFLRTAEKIIGMKPLNLAEHLAVPLYDAMTPKPRNAAPYNAIRPKVNVTATNPNTAANLRPRRACRSTRSTRCRNTARRDPVAIPARLNRRPRRRGRTPPLRTARRSTTRRSTADELAREIRRLSTNPYER